MTGISNTIISPAAIEEKLLSFDRDVHPLPGIARTDTRKHLASVIAGIAKNITDTVELRSAVIENVSTDTGSQNFDPVMTAIAFQRQGNEDEACWILFLSTYIGKHVKQGWNLLRRIYGGLDSVNSWTWNRANQDGRAFNDWLLNHQPILKTSGNFGSLHKYGHMDIFKAALTGKEVTSYVNWIKSATDHRMMLNKAIEYGAGQPNVAFDHLYHSMNEYTKFDRVIQFNYLSMLGKTGIAPIEPGKPYLNDCLAAKNGSKWLFGGSKNTGMKVAELNQLLASLAAHLELYFGIQVLCEALSRPVDEKGF